MTTKQTYLSAKLLLPLLLCTIVLTAVDGCSKKSTDAKQKEL